MCICVQCPQQPEEGVRFPLELELKAVISSLTWMLETQL